MKIFVYMLTLGKPRISLDEQMDQLEKKVWKVKRAFKFEKHFEKRIFDRVAKSLPPLPQDQWLIPYLKKENSFGKLQI